MLVNGVVLTLRTHIGEDAAQRSGAKVLIGASRFALRVLAEQTIVVQAYLPEALGDV